jgi:hypothetical protein
MTIQPGAVLNTQGFGNRPENVEVPVIETRNPTIADVNYPLGKRWINRIANSEYTLTSQSTLGGVLTSTWTTGSGAAGLTKLTGNSGTAIESAGNINVLGTGAINITGSGDTLTVSTSATTLFPITPFVVGTGGQADYTTIQAAITASAGGPAAIYIQPGAYTESLSFNAGQAISLVGVGAEGGLNSSVSIIGIHALPSTGELSFQDLNFSNATSIFSAGGAGSSNLQFTNCTGGATNGYFLNIGSWTGPVLVQNCVLDQGTTDGFISNGSGSSRVTILQSFVGAGTGNSLTTGGGAIQVDFSEVVCPVSLGAAGGEAAYSAFQSTMLAAAGGWVSVKNIYTGSWTVVGTFNASFVNDIFNTSPAAIMNMGTSGAVTFTNCTTITSAADVIFGTGTGTVNFSNFMHSLSSTISGSFTITETGSAQGNGLNYIGDVILSSESGADATVGNLGGGAATTINAGTGGLAFLTPGGQVKMFPGTVSSGTDAATLNTQYGVVRFTGQTTASGSPQTLSITNSNFGPDKAVICTVYNLNASGLDAAVALTGMRLTGTVMDVIYTNNGAGSLSTGDDVLVTFWVTN